MMETHARVKWGRTFAIPKRENANIHCGGIVMTETNVLLIYVMELEAAAIRVILDFAMMEIPAH